MSNEQETKPVETVFDWLAANLGNDALGALTGTDTRALKAAEAIIELYSYYQRPHVLEAFAIAVQAMQEHTRYLAYHTIARVMDWSDRETIWRRARLDRVRPSRCAFEPGGCHKDMREDA